MSSTLTFATSITSSEALNRACDRLRARGMAVTNRYVANYAWPANAGGQKAPAHLVKFPSWSHDCVFACDSTGRMLADNYSPYYDERKIDPATGERIPNSGRVHSRVLDGSKQVGEDGKWGSIDDLQQLQVQYSAALVESGAVALGGTILYETVQPNGDLEVCVETA